MTIRRDRLRVSSPQNLNPSEEFFRRLNHLSWIFKLLTSINCIQMKGNKGFVLNECLLESFAEFIHKKPNRDITKRNHPRKFHYVSFLEQFLTSPCTVQL